MRHQLFAQGNGEPTPWQPLQNAAAMNSTKERFGPYGDTDNTSQITVWNPKTYQSPQSSPRRRKFAEQKIKIANGIYGKDSSSPSKTKKRRLQHAVPIAMDMRELIKKVRGGSERIPRNARPLSSNNLSNGHDAISEESPGSPMSKFREKLHADAGVSIKFHAYMHKLVLFIANTMFVVLQGANSICSPARILPLRRFYVATPAI